MFIYISIYQPRDINKYAEITKESSKLFWNTMNYYELLGLPKCSRVVPVKIGEGRLRWEHGVPIPRMQRRWVLHAETSKWRHITVALPHHSRVKRIEVKTDTLCFLIIQSQFGGM